MKKRNNRFITNIFSLVTVFLFSVCCISVCIIFFLTPKKNHSIVEKRELTRFPSFSLSSLADGSFTDNITKYVSDNFVARDKLVEFSSLLENSRGIRVDGIKLYSDNASINSNQKKSVDILPGRISKVNIGFETPLLGEEMRYVINLENLVSNTEIYENLDREEITGQKVGALFIVGDTALEIFYGNSSISKDYANIINTFRLSLPSDINVYNMIVPTNFEFGLPKKYRQDVGTLQKPFIDEIYSSLDSSIKKVDAYSKIRDAYRQNEYLYFRTDHHWTALGAYRAYEAFAEKAGFEPTPLSDFENRRVDEFLGTFYSSSFDKNLKDNPDFVEFYAPTNTYSVLNYRENGIDTYKGTLVYNKVSNITHGYLVFMGGDIPLSIVETDAGTGKSIIVFKESFGNAFVPFLTRNYDKIYIADIRTFPFNAIDYITENQIYDVLFLNNIMTCCSPPRIKNYIDLIGK